jgi:type IV secretory pathway TraG/TraD family ATPase VirD4
MGIGCALSQLQDSPGEVPTVFILDELPQYCSETVSKIVAGIYSTGRKYNLRVYCAATSVGTLAKDCFPDGRHQDVLGNSGAIHILNVSDPESSRFIKELGGEKAEYSYSRTRGWNSNSNGGGSTSSTTTTPHSVPVIRQESVRAIADDSQVVLLDQCPYLIYAQTKIYREVPKLAARAGKNPFFNDNKSPAKGRTPKRKKKVDEVAILLKAYGTK